MHFSIPEFSEIKDVNQGHFTVYHIHANGILHCKLRFKQLKSLHEQLKKQFGIYSLLPYFPPKKLFPLKENEIEERRALLEKYMQIISQDDRISNSSQFNDFLLEAQRNTLNALREPIKLDVLLANDSRIRCQVMSTDNSNAIKETICRELKLPIKYTPYFSLFIAKEQAANESSNGEFLSSNDQKSRSIKSRTLFLAEQNDKFINGNSSKHQNNRYVLIRKMMEFEAPYLSLQNANQISNVYHLKLIKFYWDNELDERLMENEIALSLIYLQALTDFEQQSNEINKDHYQYLESLALRQSKKEYLRFAKCVKNYGMMRFEACICDFPRPNTKCWISMKSDELILRTLLNGLNNRPMTKDFILKITRIKCWRLTTGFDLRADSKRSFSTNSLLNSNKDLNDFKYELSIEYLFSKDDLKWIVIKSEQAVLMSTCLKSTIEELVLKKNNLILYNEKSSEISVNLRKNSCNYYKSNDKSLNDLNHTRSLEKSISIENFSSFTESQSKPFSDDQCLRLPKNFQKIRSLVQNNAYDGIGDDDL